MVAAVVAAAVGSGSAPPHLEPQAKAVRDCA